MITSVIQWWSDLSTPMKWLTGIGAWCAVAGLVGPVIGRGFARRYPSDERGCTPDIHPEAGRTRAERAAWQLARLPSGDRATHVNPDRLGRQHGEQLVDRSTGETLIHLGGYDWDRPRPSKRDTP